MKQQLQEYCDSGGVTVRLDSQAGILRGVKLIGLTSRNGRRYTEVALQDAVSLYEGAKVNVNHPKEGPLSPRDYQDRLGVIRNVSYLAGAGLFGDLHFNPKHTLAEQLLWDAEHNPQNVGFSHNVLARLSRESDLLVVEEITKVQSVDLVADPATTRGLFEHAPKDTAQQEEFCWEELSLELVQAHRPDLLKEVDTANSQELRGKLNEAHAQIESLQKRQRVFELLCEHKLSIATEPTPTTKAGNPRSVSTEFVELLAEVADDQKLESLIVERAELARSFSQSRKSFSTDMRPRSQDQTLILADRTTSFASAQEFAASLKLSCN